jgi:hypothetical protein
MCASHIFTSFYVDHLAAPNESLRRRRRGYKTFGGSQIKKIALAKECITI